MVLNHFTETTTVLNADCDFHRKLKPGALFRYVEQAAEILMKYRKPETPVGIVRHAGRKEESKQITTLAELKNAEIDMFSVVLIGNSQTYVSKGRMITPRGYALK